MQPRASIRLGLAAAAFFAVGHAEARSLSLSLRAPSECGDATHIEAAVDELVRTPQSQPLQAELDIRRTADGYSAELRTQSARLRSVSAPSCEAVVEAATVILALAVDPRASAQPPREPSPAPQKPQPKPAPRASKPPRFEAGAATSLDSSTLPHLAAGFTLHAGLRAPRWSGAVLGTYYLPRSGALQSDPNVGGTFTWWTLALAGCFNALVAKPRLALCLEPEIGRIEGTGDGTPTDRSVAATWLAVSATPHVAFDLSQRVALRAGLGAAVAILGAHSFVLERSGEELEVHRPGRFSLRARLGLDVLF